MSTTQDDDKRNAGTPPASDTKPDATPDKPSRAAEYIAALYIALLLCTPWLLRGAPLFTPPSNGVEMQMSKAAAASPTVELRKTAKTVVR